ncbi:MAG: HtrA protease/chaperone protein / Serine protease (Protease DO) (EC 3.4.21.-) [Olavius algarvensis Gamma 3 endosymbiont]|nr:MAG: HtrA protease/chaperone protein / Serine protease (Protease DO) (EC 3.4.21.-) [Olavius algarvensis Gamma 3 endosymbiont]
MNNIKSLWVLLLLPALILAPAYAVLPSVTAQGEPFPTLAPMLKQVNSAVVNISTYSKRESQYNPLLNDPFFRRFFDLPEPPGSGEQIPERRRQSAGSGVIVDADDGIVMTNYHVIRNADEVHVSLIDGRNLGAEVVGTDPQLDVAILRVDAKDLTEVQFADSSLLEVGDFVVAIGNPFGLGQTVTTGVVSALGRSGLGIEGYENFIQTDASINPGNSGGALVNLAGELVGINTAIISPAGGNVGIGFAIPVNMAKASMRQIIEYGEVKRGQIGVGIQDITPDLREAFDLKKGQFGVLVTNVFEDSPAARAGIESGDIIIEADGKTTRSTAQLRSRIGVKEIGEEVRLSILRNGEPMQLTVKIGAAISQQKQAENLAPLLQGLRVENNPDGDGVLVVAVAPNSPAAYSGLRAGDVIVGANKRKVYDIESFKAALQRSKSSVLLRVDRNGGSLFIVIR